MSSVQIAAIGEVMIELSQQQDASYALGVAGDTFNTCVTLARLGTSCEYATALGDDTFSERIRDAIAGHGIGTGRIETLPGRLPGLYATEVDAQGERRFSYWRDSSAARQWLADPNAFAVFADRQMQCPRLYWSGITLALMTPQIRDAMHNFLRAYREAGGRVYFDSNYRDGLWPSAAIARDAYARAIEECDLYLPSLEDAAVIHRHDDVEQVIERLRRGSDADAVISIPDGAVWSRGETTCHIALERQRHIVDATGAGDAFSGAFIAARIRGLDPESCIHFAHAIARRVVEHRGALLPDHAWREIESAKAAVSV